MSQDQHYNTPDPDVPEALQDRKGTDMPAARSILVVILAVATAVVLFMTIRYAFADGDKRDAAPSPLEQAR
ncbi:MAG: hypothetical protein IPL52_15245 [Flavobacteriales bacterium]|nr:hypothetical protein [Flavobacteriales bacterium]